MPSKTFYTDASKADAIVLMWDWNWKNMRIGYQGEEIGHISSKKELRQGATISLSQEKALFIRLTNAVSPELELLVNGVAVPGTAADTHHTLKQLYFMGLILGGFNMAIGILGELVTQRWLQMLGAGFGSMIFGAALVGLAFAVKRGSIAALVASIGLWTLDLAAMFYFALEGADTPSTGALILKAYFIYLLYRGIAAARKLNKKSDALKAVS